MDRCKPLSPNAENWILGAAATLACGAIGAYFHRLEKLLSEIPKLAIELAKVKSILKFIAGSSYTEDEEEHGS